MANQNIINEAIQNLVFYGMGTTACVLIFQNNNFWISHIGDSRIYLYVKSKKRMIRLTKDHSLVQSLLDEEIISEVEALNHNEK